MNDSIFRKKSLDRANSPDALNNTIRVPQPSIWIILIALVLVCIGFFIWAIFGTLDSTAGTVVVSQNGEAGCYVSEHDFPDVKPGMELVVDSERYVLGEMHPEKCCFSRDADEYVVYLGEFSKNEYLYYFSVLGFTDQGTFKGKIITEKINAIKFLWN